MSQTHAKPHRGWRIGAAVALAILVCPTLAQASPAQRALEASARLAAPTTPAQAQANVQALAPSVKAALDAGEGQTLLAQAASNPNIGGTLASLATVSVAAHETNGRVPPRKGLVAQAARKTSRDRALRRMLGVVGAAGELVHQRQGRVDMAAPERMVRQRLRDDVARGCELRELELGYLLPRRQRRELLMGRLSDVVHMAHWASLGYSYPWGCGGFSGGKVQIRIAANGYEDNYNDYGF